MRLRNILDWTKWNWEDIQKVTPFVGQTVEVLQAKNRVVRAVYDPRWEHGFCNATRTEALTFKPTLWRNIVGDMGYSERRVPEEFMI